MVPYAHYFESKIRLLYEKSGVYERIDDKIDLDYIYNLEKRFVTLIGRMKFLSIAERFYRDNYAKQNKLEFKVNDLLTLKLENDKTFIYINEKRFIQCLRLLLQIPLEGSNLFKEVESIDEAEKIYKQSLWRNRVVEGLMARPSRFQNKTITPEQEFWGHCSNIQAWVEHDYDTRLLHSNIAFPLLKGLSDAADPKARRIFEEEIVKRFESGHASVVNYLLNQGYLQYINQDRLKALLKKYSIHCENCDAELTDLTQKYCPECGISLKFLNILNTFNEEFKDMVGIILKGRQIIYTTHRNIETAEIGKLLSTWSSRTAKFLMFSDVKYYILQLEPEQLFAVSSIGKDLLGFIIAKKDAYDYILILQVNQNS
ncbi:MAG: hypothetical protein ACFFCI_24220 [Promethearchaeota archaeon]